VRFLNCFIVNKISGNGRALRVWNQIEKRLQEKNVNYCVRFTQKPKHATSIVQELISKEKVNVIVAVGGDGTIHEVINGLIGNNIPLGIIPAGSGNDFSRGLGISLNPDKALDRILNDEPQMIDIGLIDSTYFGTVTGIGFDGKVAHVVNNSIQKKIFNIVRMGHLSYIISAIKVLFQYSPTDLSIVIDNKLYNFQKVWLIAVANLPFYGGGMIICPKAKSNDGLFDICIVQGMTKFEFLRIFPLVFKGMHISSPSVKIMKGKEIDIYSPTPLMIHGDGEMMGQTPVRIRIEPCALHVK
jgi:diacylglycerol kinase (ATP)